MKKTAIVLSAALGVVMGVMVSPVLAACWKTNLSGKCGNDSIESTTTCGSSQCNLEEHIYDTLTTCTATAASGAGGCVSNTCNRTIIKRECVQCPGAPFGWCCLLQDGSPTTQPVANGQKSNGDSCHPV
jgi:hypothetical protein